MAQKLTLADKKVAILATDGFEQSELFQPLEALRTMEAEVTILSLKKGEIKAWDKTNWGKSIAVDQVIEEASPEEFDALVLPGGVMSPDQLRMNPQVISFVRSFAESGKPIASICHGPWVLIETGVVHRLQMTSYPSIQTDLRNAGAVWVDDAVVVDQGIVTSRNPQDLPQFCEKMIEEIAEGRHEPRLLRQMTGDQRMEERTKTFIQ